MLIESHKRLIENNDIVTVRIDIITEQDENCREWFKITYTHGYLHELTRQDIPMLIYENLDSIDDSFAIVGIHLSDADKTNLMTHFNCPQLNDNDMLQIMVDKVEQFDKRWNLSEEDKLTIAKTMKQRGNYRSQITGEWNKALSLYLQATKYLKGTVCVLNKTHELNAQATRLMIDCANNLCRACLELKVGFNLCIKYADVVLSFDKVNEKAYYRKAKALMHKKNYDEAIKVLETGVDSVTNMLEGVKARYKALICECEELKRFVTEKEKAFCTNMFGKMAELAMNNVEEPCKETMSNLHDVTNWDNKWADKIMSINEELEAFGEKMPPRTGNRREPLTIHEESEDENY